ncbi:hypothetical protein EAF04_000628 [Stromatinia cepivora]|nr:hypothetical protein EAF04_000628 [Stromatinia cepivora]
MENSLFLILAVAFLSFAAPVAPVAHPGQSAQAKFKWFLTRNGRANVRKMPLLKSRLPLMMKRLLPCLSLPALLVVNTKFKEAHHEAIPQAPTFVITIKYAGGQDVVLHE